jgi:hypothetical protein
MRETINMFEQMVVWKKVDGEANTIPEPTTGQDEEFDIANSAVTEIKSAL